MLTKTDKINKAISQILQSNRAGIERNEIENIIKKVYPAFPINTVRGVTHQFLKDNRKKINHVGSRYVFKSRVRKKIIKHKRLDEETVKHYLIEWLTRRGFGTNLKYSFPKGRGVDIEVKKNGYGVKYRIEAKGDLKNKSVNEGSIMSAFGQLFLRHTVLTYLYGIGISEANFEHVFKKFRDNRWRALKNKNARILSVKDDGTVMEYTPRDIKVLHEQYIKIREIIKE